jgi:hypothetical protein
MLAAQTISEPLPLAEFHAGLKRVTSKQRAHMLMHLADLFVAMADSIGDTTVALFDDLLVGQIKNTDHDAQLALCHKLAPLANAPPRLIRLFAVDDETAIARPALSGAPRLTISDLIAVAQTRGQDHLHAICARGDIPEPLSAVLIKRGGQSVIDRLAATPGARFYVSDFARLLERVSADERHRVNVRQRGLIQTLHGMPITACTVLNVSPTGAYMKPDVTSAMPEHFAVIFAAVEQRRARCRLVWKAAAGIGVAFEANPFSAQRPQ